MELVLESIKIWSIYYPKDELFEPAY